MDGWWIDTDGCMDGWVNGQMGASTGAWLGKSIDSSHASSFR